MIDKVTGDSLLLLFRWHQKWVFVYRNWCEENEIVFVSHEVPFPATSDRRSRVAGNGTEWGVKTIELSSSTSGGEQWAFLNFLIITAVKKTMPKLRKLTFPQILYSRAHCKCDWWNPGAKQVFYQLYSGKILAFLGKSLFSLLSQLYGRKILYFC